MYLWIKALHVIAVMAWMAGLFYLPRLFVYHAFLNKSQKDHSVFPIMERKLYRYIMVPAAGATWFCGVWMVSLDRAIVHELWFLLKLISVILMTIFHFYLGSHVEQLQTQPPQRSERFFRIINEIPTLLMIVIVVCVVVKP